MYKIIHHEDKCIKCGACVSVCDNWVMKEGQFPKPKKSLVKELGCNADARDGCPVGAIEIVEE